jgi:hypothetical protein
MTAELPVRSARSIVPRALAIVLMALALAACGEDSPGGSASFPAAAGVRRNGSGNGNGNRDRLPPTVTITAPVSGGTFDANAPSVSLAGVAADDVGVTRVSWSNDAGGSGAATGTSAWSAAAVPLHPGGNTITVTAYDASGRSGSARIAVNYATSAVSANQPPLISGTPAGTVTAGTPYRFIPAASDPEGAPLTFSVSNAPAWATFDPATGTLAGTPAEANVGVSGGISISVSDGTNVAMLPAFAITVQSAPLRSATLSWTPPSQNADGSPVTDLAGFRIYYGTATGVYPQVVPLDNPGLTRYVIDNLAPGTWHFAMSAIDAAGEESALSPEVTRTIL